MRTPRQLKTPSGTEYKMGAHMATVPITAEGTSSAKFPPKTLLSAVWTLGSQILV